MTSWYRWLGSALLLGCVALLLGVPAGAAEKAATRAELSEARLKKDIFFLASDECEGRGPTTKGINTAAQYIADQFKAAGLKPGGKDGSWFQPFTIPGATLRGTAKLVLHGPLGQEIVLTQGEHFQPLGVSHSASLKEVPVVFAGYGLSNVKTAARPAPRTDRKEPPDEPPEFPYDDYKGLDVSEKVVIVLRERPCWGNRDLVWRYDQAQRFMSPTLRKMDAVAKQHGL